MELDSNTIAEARNTDMIAFLEQRHGFTFSHRGGGYRCRQHPSLAVKGDRLSWYWHSKNIGGYGVLDYLIKVEGVPFRQAVETVTNIPAAAPIIPEQPQDKQLVLPEKAGCLRIRLVNYLCHRRGIDTDIVGALLDEGSIYEDRRGNVVFVGFDECGQPRFASLRGTCSDQTFRMDCAGSDKRYGFHMVYSNSERLYIFESPIDAMSHASLENIFTADGSAWQRDNRLSLAGTSDTALPNYLERHPHTKELVLCLDSDNAGREAAVAITRKYAAKGFLTRIELPQSKDYNEDLINTIKKAKVEKGQKNAVNLHSKMRL